MKQRSYLLIVVFLITVLRVQVLFAQSEGMLSTTDIDIQTVKIPLKHITPTQAAFFLNQIKSESAEVLIDDDNDAVILIDSKEKIQQMQEYLLKVDVEHQTSLSFDLLYQILSSINESIVTNVGQFSFHNRYRHLWPELQSPPFEIVDAILEDRIPRVLIEAQMIQLVLNEDQSQGVDWSAIVNDALRLGRAEETNSVGEIKNSFITIGTISPEDYPILMDALSSVGKIEPLVATQLIILNNDESTLTFDTVSNEIQSTLKPDSPVFLRSVEGTENTQGTENRMTFLFRPVVESNNRLKLTIAALSQAEDSAQQVDLNVKSGMPIIIGGMNTSSKQGQLKRKESFFQKVFKSSRGSQDKKSGDERVETIVFLVPKIILRDDPSRWMTVSSDQPEVVP